MQIVICSLRWTFGCGLCKQDLKICKNFKILFCRSLLPDLLRKSLLDVVGGLQENKKTFVTHVAVSCVKSAFTNDTLLPIITGEILRVLTANNYKWDIENTYCQ